MKKLISITLMALMMLLNANYVSAEGISKEVYQQTITENNDKINKAQDVKNNLHILADNLRSLDENAHSDLIKSLSDKWFEMHYYQEALTNDNITFQDKITEIEVKEKEASKRTYLGKRKVTGYTPSPSENGGYDVTCTGVKLKSVIGVCCATNGLKLGTRIYIDGIGERVVMDTGCGNTIDVLCNNQSECYNIGNRRRDIWIINE